MHNSRIAVTTAISLAMTAFIAGCSREEPEPAAAPETSAEVTVPTPETATLAAAASDNYPTQVYFGDTHLHTAMSMDAGLFGNRLGVEDAYRFARGEALTASGGQPAKLSDEPRIFIYDNYPGGIGFSEPLFGMHEDLLTRTRALIAGCECQHGCPTCVGPVGNTGPLAKTVALRILDLIGAMQCRGGSLDPPQIEVA